MEVRKEGRVEMEVCSFLSVWFVVAFTVERFIAVRYPLHRPSMCTVARAKVILISLTLLALALYSPYLFISGPQLSHDTRHHDTRQNSTVMYCGLVEEWTELASLLNHVDFVLTLIVPFTLIVVLNTLISRTVWRVARIRRSMINNNNKIVAPGGGSMNHHHQSSVRNNFTSHNTQKMFQSSRRNSGGPSSQTKVTKMLLIVSSVFICLNLPSYAIRIWVYLNEPNVLRGESSSSKTLDFSVMAKVCVD
ncbi:hypothetical protein M8J77_016104 [Diaphorina citri]|nr:hypothetical protein M8J77_016104 [Diaphorina citri]